MPYSLHTAIHRARADYESDITYISYSPRYGDEIISTVEVPVKIEFISSYKSHLDYSYYDPATREDHRFTAQFSPEKWQEGRWNYPDEATFNRQHNHVNHIWGLGGEKIPDNVFETFCLMNPDNQLVNGMNWKDGDER